jgi:hypothetical protein
MLGYRLGSSADNIETPLEQLFHLGCITHLEQWAFAAISPCAKEIYAPHSSPIRDRISFLMPTNFAS